MFDYSVKGRRVRLVYTDDEYTLLRPGDEGTAYCYDSTGHLLVDWDSGSKLSLIRGVDKWEWLPEQEKDE